MHVEPGFFLTLPATTGPAAPPTIFRQGSIPHGVNVLLQGTGVTINGPPTIPNITTRSIKPDGTFNSDNYLKNAGRQGVIPAGLDPAVATNPNLLLQTALAATAGTVLQTTIITLGTGGNDGQGISNIPWLQPGVPGTVGVNPDGTKFAPVNNAAAVQTNATFWIEKIRTPGGDIVFQLQYSQVVLLNFGNVNWPHVTVATLIKQDEDDEDD